MHPSRTRVLLPALLSVIALLVAPLAFAAPASAADGDVRINEFSSNSPDFVELINTGSGAVDLSGWMLKDSTENNSLTFAPGTTLAGGQIRGLSGENVEFVFGLGNGDAVRLFNAGGTLIDSFAYPAHPPAGKSYGRCPDGTGSFVITDSATKGAANACSTPNSAVRINEFSSNNPDFIELINTGGGPVDLSGWILKDNSENNSYTFPAGSSIASGAIKALSGEGVEFVFGLGGGDSVRLFAPGTIAPIDSYTYPAHPPAGKSYGRCPNGTGDFVVTAAATKGTGNSCPLPAGAANIKVNEVESDPSDLVELVNIGDAPVDISGYRIKDNDDTHVFTLAAGTTLAAGAYTVIDVNPSFGLGKGDSVRLYTPDGANLLDSTTYPADTHATTWGRCPDGTGAFGVTTSTLGAANACGPVLPPDVVINEVESNGDQVADWVELKNLGTTPAVVSGWKIVDGDAGHAATPVVVPANTVIPAGGYYAIYTEIAQSPGFGLGVGDSVNLFLPDGTTQVDTTLVDSTTWGAHPATTWGRCPDGTGAFRETTTPTRGLANACSPVRINEIESNGTDGDWIELKNIGSGSADISGWQFQNAAGTTYTLGGLSFAGAYATFDQSAFGFDLGATDTLRLLDATGTVVESYSWTAHATQTYGRCKDGVGDFKDTKVPTKGGVNSCPGLETQPWPGSQSVTTADLPGTFLQDLSGLAFDPADADVLWASQNKAGTLFKLVRDGANWVPASGWPKDPKYLDGTGAPDTEGLTLGPDGFVYLASERNNAASGVSRMSVLRYDPSSTGTTITPTAEWNLTGQIPAAGANLGLEGVTWVPDSYLTAGGFVDQSTNAAYDPSGYPLHGTGLYVVAVEDTGDLHAFALDSDGTTAHKIATIDSGFEHLADVSFDAERGRLWAVTDDTHDGKTSLLRLDAGSFVVDVAYDRPVEMPNINNEGLAIAPQSRCVEGKKEVLWADDGDTGGNSLRRGTINCTVLSVNQDVAFTSEAPAGAVVGQTYEPTTTGGGSGNPVVLTIAEESAGQCSLTDSEVTFEHPGSCVIRADQAAGPGYLAGSATQEVVVGKAGSSVTLAITATTMVAEVSTNAGVETDGSVDFTVDGNAVGTAPVVAGVATLAYVVPSGADRIVGATYSGNGDLTSSAVTTARLDPTITASVSSSVPKSAAGWYSSPVTVTFTCTPRGAALTAPCPDPVTLSGEGADQSVTRSIAAVNGGEASVSVGDLDIDLTAPKVGLTRVRPNFIYIFGGHEPPAECVASDALSGIESCTVTHTHVGTRWTSTAVAFDNAGNSTTYAVTYTALVLFAKP